MASVPVFRKKVSRRKFIQALGLFSILGIGNFGLFGCANPNQAESETLEGPGLGQLARSKGRQYGVAAQSWQLEEQDYAEVIRVEASMLVPENELKWYKLRPAQNAFDFTGYRRLAAFAQANDMAMRGHVLVWYTGNPDWLTPALARRDAAMPILKRHIDTVIAETSSLIRNWDVVNEAIDPESSRSDGLRESPWLTALGPEYMPLAFKLAYAADPGLTLAYNDYGLEQEGSPANFKRTATLRVLEWCLKNNAPIHTLGLQSHLQAHRPLAAKEFLAFLREIRGMGLKVSITELDLDVSRLSGPMKERVEVAQNYVRVYLDFVQLDAPVDMLLTWGLSDRYTWLREQNPNIAGALPLDRNFRRGPMWDTLEEAWLGV